MTALLIFAICYISVGLLLGIMAIPSLSDDNFIKNNFDDLDSDDVKEYNNIKSKWESSPSKTFCRIVLLYPLFLFLWIVVSLFKKIFKKEKQVLIKTIVKRDGTKEPFSPKKLNGWGLWASEKLGNTVDWSEVVLHIASTSKDEVTSVELHNMFISYCLTKRSFDYNRMAGRLYIAYLNKELYGDKYPTVKELLTKLSNHGLVSKDFLEAFTDDEYVQLEKIIDHSIDLNYAHYQIEQAMEKYSLRDRVTGQYFETPQFSALRVAMQMCKNRKNRIERIKRHYNQIKSDILNVPTPLS